MERIDLNLDDKNDKQLSSNVYVTAYEVGIGERERVYMWHLVVISVFILLPLF
jgi:hypothetical protein